MNRFYTILCVVAAAMAVMTSCSDDPVEPPVIYPIEPSTRHTLLIYMGIDNNFAAESNKIERFRRYWDMDYDGNLLVYADGGSNSVFVHIHNDRYGNIIADTVSTYPAENSADPEVFNRVLKKAYNEWPAEINGLVVLSHGSGWLREGKLNAPTSRTVVHDKEGELELWDFASNIPIKLDYIIFDACFTAGVEMASELYGKTKYLMGSSAEILVDYVNYEKLLQRLIKGNCDLAGIADDSYDHAMSQSLKALTMSVINVDRFKEMEEFCSSVLRGRIIENDVNIRSLQQFHPIYPLFTDLGDLIENLEPGYYSHFLQILNEAVVYEVSTGNYYSVYNSRMNGVRNHSGLTIYIPQSGYPNLNSDYTVTKWYKAVYGE